MNPIFSLEEYFCTELRKKHIHCIVSLNNNENIFMKIFKFKFQVNFPHFYCMILTLLIPI